MELHVELVGPGVSASEGKVSIKGFHQITQLGHLMARAVREHVRSYQLTPHASSRSWRIYMQWHGAAPPPRKVRPAGLRGLEYADEPEDGAAATPAPPRRKAKKRATPKRRKG